MRQTPTPYDRALSQARLDDLKERRRAEQDRQAVRDQEAADWAKFRATAARIWRKYLAPHLASAALCALLAILLIGYAVGLSASR